MTLAQHFERLARVAPKAPAVVNDRGIGLTRKDLWERSGAIEAGLLEAGVSEGDIVMIVLPNWDWWVVTFLAVLRAQAIPATVPTTIDEEALGSLISRTGASAVIVPSEYRSRLLGEQAIEASRAAGHTATVVEIDARDREQVRWIAAGNSTPPRIGPRDRGGHVMFTSSTTGAPKAVVHSENSLAALNIGIRDRYRLNNGDPIFMASPLGHSVGASHGVRLSFFLGAPLILQDEWDPERAVGLVRRHRAAFTAAATPFLKDLVDVKPSGAEPKLATLRVFLCGGAPVPPSLIDSAKNELPRTFVSNLWGMTEGGVTTCETTAPHEKVRNSAGRPLPGLEIAVRDRHGSEMPIGSAGELTMRGPGLFIGYLDDDDLYRRSLTSDGYFRTGDEAVVDTEGYLTITGRIKDLIIRGGVNISPLPTEAALAAHPQVHKVAVIGVPDDRLGEKICAVIVPRGDSPSLPELVAWADEQGLPKRQLPEELRIVGDMPMTAAGKIQKNRLRQQILELQKP